MVALVGDESEAAGGGLTAGRATAKVEAEPLAGEKPGAGEAARISDRAIPLGVMLLGGEATGNGAISGEGTEAEGADAEAGGLDDANDDVPGYGGNEASAKPLVLCRRITSLNTAKNRLRSSSSRVARSDRLPLRD